MRSLHSVVATALGKQLSMGLTADVLWSTVSKHTEAATNRSILLDYLFTSNKEISDFNIRDLNYYPVYFINTFLVIYHIISNGPKNIGSLNGVIKNKFCGKSFEIFISVLIKY